MPACGAGQAHLVGCKDSSGTSASSYYIIGGALGGLALLVIVVGGLYQQRMRQLEQQAEDAREKLQRMGWCILPAEIQYEVPQGLPEELRNHPDIRRPLGDGSFGIVYAATYRGFDVAVKELKGRCFPDPMTDPHAAGIEFDQEASMLVTLVHDNIVRFFGAGTTRAEYRPFLVLERMWRSLATVLEDPSIPTDGPHGEYGFVLDWPTRVLCTMGIARGLGLVHSLKRVHLDIKSANILVNVVGGRLHPKISDFGTARLAFTCADSADNESPGPAAAAPRVQPTFMPSAADPFPRVATGDVPQDDAVWSRSRTVLGPGTWPWMAPEMFDGDERQYGPPADVYSFGIVMWEIASRKKPFYTLQYEARLREVPDSFARSLRKGDRPTPISALWPDLYVDCMRRCWIGDTHGRPSMRDALAMLQELRDQQAEAEAARPYLVRDREMQEAQRLLGPPLPGEDA